MSPALRLALYCLVIVVGSLAGGSLPTALRLTHTRMQVIVSFVAGVMLGVSLFHLIPHAAKAAHSLDQVVHWTAGGLLVMFLLLRTFHFHEHEVGLDHGHEHPHTGGQGLAWVGVALGIGLHSILDGVALAASVVAESHGGVRAAGLGTFAAVLLHKPLDALAITSLMAAGGWTGRARNLVNVGVALMCPLGAALFYAGAGAEPGVAVGCALAFSAGVFLCISLGDLLPELQFHRHDRIKLSLALLVGVALSYAIGFLETGFHDHPPH